MSLPDAALLEALSHAELRDVVGVLVSQARQMQSDNAALHAGVEAQQATITALRAEMQALRDEVAGQVTTERLTALLNGVGVEISKRQVVRLLTSRLDDFVAEDRDVLRAGLATAGWVTVDDTSARHARADGVTTQIGDARFTAFRTGTSKSREAFLSVLRAGHTDYVVNAAALEYMRGRGLAGTVIALLEAHPTKAFADAVAWTAHLASLGIDQLAVTPAPMLIATEGALWGAIRHHGLLAGTVIVSNDAGQFRVGTHALCWVHAERLVHKLVPATPEQRRAVEVTRALIWWLYADLKAWKQDPCPRRAAALRACFDRIFTRQTGYVTLDGLLARLHRRTAEPLCVLQHPAIPLHTNGSENDIRACVTKRKISGGTMSTAGRTARDVLLGLTKTCGKLGVSFFRHLGERLHVPGSVTVPPLPGLYSRQHARPDCPGICPGYGRTPSSSYEVTSHSTGRRRPKGRHVNAMTPGRLKQGSDPSGGTYTLTVSINCRAGEADVSKLTERIRSGPHPVHD